jgi:hypothetical protein
MDIPFEGQLSKHDWSKITTLHYKPTKVSSLFRVAGLIVLCLILLFLIKNAIFDSGYQFIFFFCFILLSHPYWVGYLAPLSYNKSKAQFKPLTGLVNDENIIVLSPTGSSEYKWGLYKQVKQMKDLLLLYQGKNCFNYFPRSFFESDASWQAFLDLVQQKIKKK